jgi:hypothetical protein
MFQRGAFSIRALFLIAIGIIVVTILVLSMSIGWQRWSDKLEVLLPGDSLQSAVASCAFHERKGDEYSYCDAFSKVHIHGVSEYVNCLDERIAVHLDDHLRCRWSEDKYIEEQCNRLSVEEQQSVRVNGKSCSAVGCKVHLSGNFIVDDYSSYYGRPLHGDGDDTWTRESIIWQADKYSLMLGNDSYPHLLTTASDIKNTFSSMAVAANTRVEIYEYDNFRGEVVFAGDGPLLVYHGLPEGMLVDDSVRHIVDELFRKNWKEPLQSEFSEARRERSSSDMANWIWSPLVRDEQGEYSLRRHSGSMRVLCLRHDIGW